MCSSYFKLLLVLKTNQHGLHHPICCFCSKVTGPPERRLEPRAPPPPPIWTSLWWHWVNTVLLPIVYKKNILVYLHSNGYNFNNHLPFCYILVLSFCSSNYFQYYLISHFFLSMWLISHFSLLLESLSTIRSTISTLMQHIERYWKIKADIPGFRQQKRKILWYIYRKVYALSCVFAQASSVESGKR